MEPIDTPSLRRLLNISSSPPPQKHYLSSSGRSFRPLVRPLLPVPDLAPSNSLTPQPTINLSPYLLTRCCVALASMLPSSESSHRVSPGTGPPPPSVQVMGPSGKIPEQGLDYRIKDETLTLDNITSSRAVVLPLKVSYSRLSPCESFRELVQS